MSLLPNFQSESDRKRKPLSKKQKRRITVRCAAALAAAAGIAAAALALKSSKVPAKYGIEDGAVTYTEYGKDITEEIKSTAEMQRLLSSNGASMYIDNTGAVYFETAAGTVFPLNKTEHGFTSEPNEKQSAFSITYLDASGAKKEMFSNSSVSKNQFRVYKGKNSFSVQYLLGDNISENIIPTAVEKEKFEKQILAKLSESEQAFLKRQYFLYSLSSFKDEKERKNILLKYPALKSRDLYILLNSVNTDSQVGKKLTAAFGKAGYTASDAVKDNEENLISSGNPLSFLITLDYRIEDGCAVMSISPERLKFYRASPLLGITLNKYTVSQNEKGGSLFLPYGNGCVINTASGAGQLSGKRRVKVYGEDASAHTVISGDSSALLKCTMPLFGCYNGSCGVLTVIESGASAAAISCERNKNGAYAFADFDILQSDTASLSGKTSSVTVGNDILNEDITLRYAFFEKEDISYSDFADYYRKYLEEKGTLKKNGAYCSPLFSAGFIGGITVKDSHLNTFPYDRFAVLSDYRDMKNMTEWLINNGVDNMAVNISGYNKGGLFSQYPGKICEEKKLSLNTDRSKLTDYLAQNKITSFFSAGFNYYYNANKREGRYKTAFTAQFADKSYVQKHAVSPVTKAENTKLPASEVISPYFFDKIAESCSAGVFKEQNLNVGHLCDALNSDYNTKHYFDRTRARKQTEITLKKLTAGKRLLSSNDANEYALPYTSLINDISAAAVLPDFIDYDIPFKQMLLHGYTGYTASLEGDANGERHALLKAIEGGAGIYYNFIAHSDIELKNSEFSYLNNFDFERTKNKAAENYAELKKALSGLEGVKISSHSVLSNGIRKVTYENGTVILINLSDTERAAGEITVGALSYLRTDN